MKGNKTSEVVNERANFPHFAHSINKSCFDKRQTTKKTIDKKSTKNRFEIKSSVCFQEYVSLIN